MDADRIAALLQTPPRSTNPVARQSSAASSPVPQFATPVAMSAHKTRRHLVTPPSPYCADDSAAEIPILLRGLSADSVSTLFDRIVVRHHPELAAHLAESPWHAREVAMVPAPTLVSVAVTPELQPPARRPSPSPQRPAARRSISDCEVVVENAPLAEEETRSRCQLEQAEFLSRHALHRFEGGHRGLSSKLTAAAH